MQLHLRVNAKIGKYQQRQNRIREWNKKQVKKFNNTYKDYEKSN
jgi:hypothetical protein